MNGAVVFSPVLPWAALGVISVLAIALLGLLAWRDRRALVWRSLALGALMIALVNPRMAQEKREHRQDVAVVVLDQSLSQEMAGRLPSAQAAYDSLMRRLATEPGLTVRTVNVTSDETGTRVVEALSRAIALTPKAQFAGAVVITDGQVHDAGSWRETAGAPVHVLLNGAPDERDRRVDIVRAPAYAITGKPISVYFNVQDPGAQGGRAVPVTVYVNGEVLKGAPETVRIGVDTELRLTPDRAGVVSVEVSVAAAPGEVSVANNKAIATVNGVRDRMKVLLISGQPHPGERTWRNLLKSDPSIDLVHFTILRPPEKDDFTPLDELSLIAFPTQELFERRLKEFDLVVFDRYLVRDLLPPAYYANIDAYVRGGGAMLMAAGPEYAGARSMARTALRGVLPVMPKGKVLEAPYRAALTKAGKRHPVTAGLGTAAEQAAWGRWFRLVETDLVSGGARRPQVLMKGPGDNAVLVLDRVGKGRVGVLTSDHVWLWARGYDGGGPHTELLRRMAHWLMKEPALEEEALSARIDGDTLFVERRALGDATGTVTVIDPNGTTHRVPLSTAGDGRARAEVAATAMGLYRVQMAGLTARAAKGNANPTELRDLRVSDKVLAPLVDATGGGVFWMGGATLTLPDVRRIRAGREAAGHYPSGGGWLGLKRNDAFSVTGLTDAPLIPLPLLLGLAALALIAGWWREGR